jgi:predicted RNase H-like HicB family nuclease
VKTIIIPIPITYLPEGYYLVTSDVLPGLIAQGNNIDETIEIAEDVARNLISIELEENRREALETDPESTYLLDIHVPIPVSVWHEYHRINQKRWSVRWWKWDIS